MVLCIDIGNTNIVMGLFGDDELIGRARFSTSNIKTSDECGLQATHLVQRFRTEGDTQVEDVVICSVVPSLTPRVAEMSRVYLSVEPLIVSSRIDLGITVSTRNPHEVGSDRLVNALAASKIYRSDCIVIDFGTATTFDLVTAGGEYLGGVIAPGVETAAANLAHRAAQLFLVEISPPENVIGKSTEDAMRSGIFWGQAEMINGMITRIENEFGGKCTIVTTGGYGEAFAAAIERDAVFNADLTLEGLRIVLENVRA